MALFNVMVLNGNSYPVVTAIKDCTGHFSQAGKKDALFSSDVFSNFLLEFNAEANRVDVFYFDGASNVQKAGKLLGVKFPRIVTYHGGEHVVALWFSDLAKIPEIKVCFTLFLLFCFLLKFLYKFSSFLSETRSEGVPLLQRCVLRSKPSLVRIFLAYSKKMFGHKLSLLRGSGNHMAPFFYATRLLRLKDVLIATVHSLEFAKLDLNARAKAFAWDIQNPKFSKSSMSSARLCSLTSCSFDGAISQRR